MKKNILFAAAALCLLTVGCEAKTEIAVSTNTEAAVLHRSSAPTARRAASQDTETQPAQASVPLGMQFDENGSPYLSKQGLEVFTNPPAEEAAKAAWDYFSLSGQHKYDDALRLLQGYDTDDPASLYAKYTDAGSVYLKEITGANLIRWADITQIAPKETEDEGAYAYKVIYLEMDFTTRGALTAEQTDIHDGINIYSVHVRQEQAGGDWKIGLFAGAPPLES
ncbi:hypothetical protein QWJ34_16705 [Saccharibacillus sp. CPCC 101409]|uniref:hypothetical protein n=1 Tax=Saccharibacillus sp. CPCC 101409 TaxID=3058041 RepID=UPI00267345DB|nr:hypothetical protein [Saccharibacillus sp. CPCC 101409]MDO3411409.1 hypothetical protein [Saccharibacillus sp. CPCC 101409]